MKVKMDISMLEKIAKFLVFFGLGWIVLASLGFWILPMLFGWSIHSFSINLGAGILMISTFFGLMVTGILLWVSLENKKK